MEAPLLQGRADDYAHPANLKELRSVVWGETVKTWSIAGPVIFQIVCQYGQNSITNIFAGRLSELEFSAVAISISVVATFAFGFMRWLPKRLKYSLIGRQIAVSEYGMGSAAETLCGQAFGMGQLYMLGVYMQRSWIVSACCCVILLPIYIFATPILKLLGQADDVANLAGQLALISIPQLFSFAIAFPTQKFLQAQSKVAMLAWIGFVALILHAGLLWLFIFALGWGAVGAPMACNISSWAIAIAQVIYVTGWCKDAWKGLSWLAFRDLWGFFRLSIASAVMICLEVWYTMIIIVLTGHLKNAVLAIDSLNICMNLNGWENIIFIGINAAMSVRVSNELGLGRPRAAKYSVYVTVSESLILGLFFMVLIFIIRDHFAVLFTSSIPVQQAASKLAYLLGITMVLNSVQPVISGVAVGGGWQALVAYINLGCYYIFGLPLGLILGYVANLGVKGLWGGMIAGIAMQTLLLLIVLYKTNWNKEVAQTTERMKRWAGEGKAVDGI